MNYVQFFIAPDMTNMQRLINEFANEGNLILNVSLTHGLVAFETTKFIAAVIYTPMQE